MSINWVEWESQFVLGSGMNRRVKQQNFKLLTWEERKRHWTQCYMCNSWFNSRWRWGWTELKTGSRDNQKAVVGATTAPTVWAVVWCMICWSRSGCLDKIWSNWAKGATEGLGKDSGCWGNTSSCKEETIQLSSKVSSSPFRLCYKTNTHVIYEISLKSKWVKTKGTLMNNCDLIREVSYI